ncbi:MAG: hypothetical protein ACRCVT_14115, partial [Leadbetterella sp.]
FEIDSRKKTIFWIFVCICVLLFFSGIGSYTFQNNDHLYRNAIFRDLVTKDWPVLYEVKGFSGHQLNGKITMMTYYMGYFLPSAWIGKHLGFEVGKFALLLWSILGTFLVFLQISRFLKSYSWKTFLLFISWGTLFYLGSIWKFGLEDVIRDKNYLWAGMVLYSESNLGSIYWTFNQSITSWLILLIIIQNLLPKQLLFWYGLCFFLSPFAFVGMSPFVGYAVLNRVNYKKFISYFSLENILSGTSVILLTFLYLQNNKAGQFFRILDHDPRKLLAFYVLSWGVIAAILIVKYWNNRLFWLTLVVLTPLPFFQQGHGIDFPGRLSLPALFILMLLVGKHLLEYKNKLFNGLIICYLIFSFVGHVGLEFGRSLYFTGAEHWGQNSNLGKKLSDSKNPVLHYVGEDMENLRKKPSAIKDLGTLTNPKNDVIWNYMADIETSLFYKTVAKK